MQCYEKNAYHASCKKTCYQGIHPDDPEKSPWTCKKLGPRTPGNWPSPSFFCWVLSRSSGDEAALVKMQLANTWGIFQCEESAVFSDIPWDLGFGRQSFPIGNLTAQKGEWGSWLNTMVFTKAWHSIYENGQYLMHDWVVKADPDTAFFLNRLKASLASVPLGEAWAIDNSDADSKVAMLGPIEILNRAAMEVYFANNPPSLSGTDRAVCENPWMGASGEDGFLSGCLSRLGVKGALRRHMLLQNIPVECRRGEYVAFHPAKTTAEFARCMQEALGPNGGGYLRNCALCHI